MSPPPPRYRYSDRLHKSHERAARARELRKRQTPPEGILWSKLRHRHVDGLKFRRQHPVGPYVLDFFCEEIRLAVEVDGEVHRTQVEQDARRDRRLADQGITMMRFTASEVTTNLDGVVEMIRRQCKQMRQEKEKGR